MIVNCAYCNMDTGGNHELGCPFYKPVWEIYRNEIIETSISIDRLYKEKGMDEYAKGLLREDKDE